MSMLRNRNFLLMFLGRVVTNIGDSLYAVAAMWLVSELGGSTFYTGVAGFLTIIPRFIQFFSGPIIDRVNIRSLLIYTQLIQAVLLLLIPIAHYMDFLTVGLVLIVSPILSTFNMFVYPAQMSSLPQFVEDRNLSKANSMFTFANQGIETGCNALAGILLVSIGATSIYLLDSVMFMMSTLLFAMIKVSRVQHLKSSGEGPNNLIELVKKYGSELTEGIQILFNKTVSRLLFGIILINLVGGATFVVLPQFSKGYGGAEIYGLLLMAQALGSLLGALSAPYLRLESIGMGKIYAVAFMLSGLLWTLSVFCPYPWLMIFVYGLAWFPGGVTNILINTYLQKGIPTNLLGRVFSAAYSLSGIAMPIGSLIGGIVGQMVDGKEVIGWSGFVVILVGIYWMLDYKTRSLPNAQNVTDRAFIS